MFIVHCLITSEFGYVANRDYITKTVSLIYPNKLKELRPDSSNPFNIISPSGFRLTLVPNFASYTNK